MARPTTNSNTGQRLADAGEAEREQALVARVTAGDSGAFGELVDLYIGRAYSLAFRVMRHHEDAEDLVQNAMLSALAHIEAFDPRRRFWPWLARIIVNSGLDMAAARSVRATEPIPEEVPSPGASPADLAERRELMERFRHALALLPPRQQLVVQLFELDGYSVSEIADLLSSTQTAVRWNLQAGRTRLREALGRFKGDTP